MNIGGWLAVNDWELFEELREPGGGLPRGCTPTAGCRAAIWRRWRSGSSNRCRTTTCAHEWGRCATWRAANGLGRADRAAGWGGMRFSWDARAFYRGHPAEQFPAQTLAAELYLDSGIRSMERGW